jgi:nucleoid-associated protein YgaU
MTSDAKIGLLLGLVFIFIIAFIINGLPNLRPQTTKAEVTTSVPAFTDEDMGLAEREQRAQEVLNWEELLEQQDEGLDGFDETVANAGLGNAGTEASGRESMLPTAVEGEDEDVRRVLPLPSAETVERLTQGLGNIIKDLADASRSATAQEETTEPAPVVETPEPRGATRAETREIARSLRPPSPRSANVPKVYVVAEGDSLASVAKKAYGEEEGNRMVNIQRIFEANRNVLNSPDEIFVGQKLVVPPLPAAGAADKTPGKALPKTLFEKVESIGREQLAGMDRKATEGRYYVVQDGDSLWKIATTQLGNGARYEEIAKLNADVLTDSDALKVGARLRLPSK